MIIETDNELPWAKIESALVGVGFELTRIDATRWKLRSKATSFKCNLCGKDTPAAKCVQIGKEILCTECYRAQRG